MNTIEEIKNKTEEEWNEIIENNNYKEEEVLKKLPNEYFSQKNFIKSLLKKKILNSYYVNNTLERKIDRSHLKDKEIQLLFIQNKIFQEELTQFGDKEIIDLLFKNFNQESVYENLPYDLKCEIGKL